MSLRQFLLPAAALLVATSAFAQYKMEPISTAAPDLPAAYATVIQSKGYRITGTGVWCEIWFRTSIPTGPKSEDAAVAFPIAQGTLLAILRFPAAGADRRGQAIKPGLYTLRYSLNPTDGDHGGVAPQRDFALMTPIAEDKDPAAKPEYDKLIGMSQKASGTPHPAVLSIEPPTAATLPALSKEGDSDWSLGVKVGDLPIGVILIGKVAG